MDLLRRILYSALLNLIFSVLEVNGEYCYYVYSYYYYNSYYECDGTTSSGSIAGAVVGTIIFIVIIVGIIAVCKNHNRTRVTTIHNTPHTGGTTVITQQQQQQAPPPMMYGQYPQPGGVMYNQPAAYPPPQANYPPPQGNYPPKY
ncbi:TM2 domain-containing protein DDB_G0277895-like isoform X7 [Mytilus californianus]|uniref:TM2 domain-containing protein DDB_G0277895-like isoform X7 n=1 Tax=Mytilus californianus TaxID=6549 RepID=UPI0022450BD7|nr:TM2 domain-containing protein DDB_G0277895-like isoform X7 [Mytilus californianus]